MSDLLDTPDAIAAFGSTMIADVVGREAGMAQVALSVVEQRLDAVRAVLAGATVTEVSAQVGVSRQSLHT